MFQHGNGADVSAKKKYTILTANSCDDGFADLALVKSFTANPWKLYDLHGNVWEWVWDWQGDYPEEPSTDVGGPSSGDRRVLRGGSFNYWPGGLRSASRVGSGPMVRFRNNGLRCARGFPPA